MCQNDFISYDSRLDTGSLMLRGLHLSFQKWSLERLRGWAFVLEKHQCPWLVLLIKDFVKFVWAFILCVNYLEVGFQFKILLLSLKDCL